jgi:hypothetical protein
MAERLNRPVMRPPRPTYRDVIRYRIGTIAKSVLLLSRGKLAAMPRTGRVFAVGRVTTAGKVGHRGPKHPVAKRTISRGFCAKMATTCGPPWELAAGRQKRAVGSPKALKFQSGHLAFGLQSFGNACHSPAAASKANQPNQRQSGQHDAPRLGNRDGNRQEALIEVTTKIRRRHMPLIRTARRPTRLPAELLG